jgi:hypothetical protein
MTEEKIRKWATDVWGVSNWTQIQIGRLKRFAEMARNDEREGCAKIADVYVGGCVCDDAKLIAEDIRARGQS